MPWHCIGEFIAVTTNSRIFDRPLTPHEATSAVDGWLAAPGFADLAEGPEHWKILSKLVRDLGRTGPRVYDVRIAAVCIEHGVSELLSADRDLTGVPGLSIRNPLL